MRLKLALASVAAAACVGLGFGGTAQTADAAVGRGGPHVHGHPVWAAPHYQTRWVPGHRVGAHVAAHHAVRPVYSAPVVYSRAPLAVRPGPFYRRSVVGVHVGGHHGRVNVGVGGFRVGVGW